MPKKTPVKWFDGRFFWFSGCLIAGGMQIGSLKMPNLYFQAALNRYFAFSIASRAWYKSNKNATRSVSLSASV